MLMYYAFTPNSVFKSVLPFGLRTYLINQYVILRYCPSNLCKWNYLYGDLPYFKIQVNHFMAQDKPFGAKIFPKYILWVRSLVPFWVLRHSSLSLTGCLWLYNIQLKTSRGVLFLPPSDAYVRSFLYLLTLNKTLLHKSSERSSLVSGPRLNSSPPGAKNPRVVTQQQPFRFNPWSGKIPHVEGQLSLYVTTTEAISRDPDLQQGKPSQCKVHVPQ